MIEFFVPLDDDGSDKTRKQIAKEYEVRFCHILMSLLLHANESLHFIHMHRNSLLTPAPSRIIGKTLCLLR